MLYALDFFCGAGGLTRGFLDAGIKVIAGLDVNEDCKRSYEANNKPSRFVSCDLRSVTSNEIRRYLTGIPRDKLVFAGCAPCQPFSKINKHINSGSRTLLAEFGRLVSEFLPAYVVIENVPGLVKVPGNSTYRRFIKSLKKLRYKVDAGCLDAKYFGVPQTRRRWVVIASRIASPSLPARTHGTKRRPLRTVRQAIGHYPPIKAGETLISIPNHRAAAITDLNLKRLRATPADGGRRTSWPKKLILDCHAGDYSGHSDVYGRMQWDEPSPALTCKCFSISNGRYGHPKQHRAISLREAASLQTFAETFKFYGPSQAAIGAQIGNAVPVKLAKVLAKSIVALDNHARRKTPQKLCSEGVLKKYSIIP